MDKSAFPAFLKALRAETGMTQSELAAKVEVTLGAVQKWEAGDSFPYKRTMGSLIALASAAGMSSWLCEITTDAPRSDDLPGSHKTADPYSEALEQQKAAIDRLADSMNTLNAKLDLILSKLERP